MGTGGSGGGEDRVPVLDQMLILDEIIDPVIVGMAMSMFHTIPTSSPTGGQP